jgi:hypothetical protein
MTVPPVAPAAQAAGPAGDAVDVQEVVAGRRDPDEVCRFLTEVVRVAVADVLGRRLPGGAGPVQVRVTRSKLKPGRKLTVSVDVAGDGAAERPATVTWLPGARPSVLAAPDDPAFPQLVDVYDPARLAGILGATGVTGFENGLRATPLRYRPGQRHVLVVESLDRSVRLFAKCYREGSGAEVVTASRSVAEALSEHSAPARTARAAGHVPSHGLVLWHGEEGAPLSRVLVGEGVGARARHAHVGRVGVALRAIHDGKPRTGGGRQRSDPAAEAAATRRSLEHVAALAADHADTLEALLSETVARLAELPDETGHLLHGDYKCDNLLVTDDGLVLLDFDRVTVGDPALDLGKLLADLRWWSRAAGRSPADLVDAFLYGYGPCPPTRLTRALLYDVLFQLRALGRRIPLHERGWSTAVELGLDAATDCARGCSRETTRQTRRVLGARAR